MSNKPQLFCLTFAGGTGAFFDEIAGALPALEVVAPDYPGHGSRHREPFAGSMGALAEDALAQLAARYAGGRYALFGYSMGCVALVELLRLIAGNGGLPAPERVFLAAHEPRARAELADWSDDCLDEWIKARTLRFGGVPEKLRHNQSFWRMYLPLYRADYRLIQGYDFEALDFRTRIPASVFYSEADTPRAEMERWRQHFTGECVLHAYSGDHFFIRDHFAEMAAVITRELGFVEAADEH